MGKGEPTISIAHLWIKNEEAHENYWKEPKQDFY